MESLTDRILALAKLNLDARAMNDAALADDLDEARFRIRLIVARATEYGLTEVAEAAEEIAVLLRDPPLPGYGHAMLRLATLLTP